MAARVEVGSLLRFAVILALLSVPIHGASAQSERFRFSLQEDTTLPAEARRTIDSLNAIEDSLHSCPARIDTLWTADLRRPIPTVWLDASVRLGCRIAGLPLPIRRRLRDDPASLPYYEKVVRGGLPASEAARATAMQILGWSAEPRFLELFLAEARSVVPSMLSDGDYNAAYNAILALAPYASSSREARRLILRAALDRHSPTARMAGALALATVNDEWARAKMRALPSGLVDQYTEGQVKRALAHPACRKGLVLVHHLGIGSCELSPDYR